MIAFSRWAPAAAISPPASAAWRAASVRSRSFADLADAARDNLARTGAHNVSVEVMDAMTLDGDGAYDVIALTGSLPVYDPRFERALTVGGRLFVVTGQGSAMDAQRVTRTGQGQWLRESLFETVIDALDSRPAAAEVRFLNRPSGSSQRTCKCCSLLQH